MPVSSLTVAVEGARAHTSAAATAGSWVTQETTPCVKTSRLLAWRSQKLGLSYFACWYQAHIRNQVSRADTWIAAIFRFSHIGNCRVPYWHSLISSRQAEC